MDRIDILFLLLIICIIAFICYKIANNEYICKQQCINLNYKYQSNTLELCKCIPENSIKIFKLKKD